MAFLAAALLGAPALTLGVNTDGRAPGSVPQLNVPPAPEFEDVYHPPFEPYPVEAGELLHGALLEQFAGEPSEVRDARWQVFSGDWAVEPPTTFVGFADDQGLVLKSEQLSSAIARKTPAILDTASGTEPFVVQYEVKTQQVLRCGGAYLKLLPPSNEDNSAPLVLNSDTQYVVMFGPDRCPPVDKVHLILKDRDGLEHHLQQPPRTRSGMISTLYTLAILPDQTFEIRINGAVMRAGSLLDSDEFDPPLVPPREIPDPNDKKPANWAEDEMIPDPTELEKPADWDENEPYLIHDPEATKPAGWHEDWPLFIPDPDAKKPEVWDDEEDGEWVPQEIMNPRCAKLDLESGEEGCGEWLAPLVRNPAFRGKWAQPYVPNPDYQGEWAPRLIPNSAFDESVLQPNKLSADIGGVGFELMTVQGDLLFDNLYVGHSLVDAENIGNATWSPKYYIEMDSQGRAADARRKQMEELDAREMARPRSGWSGWGELVAEYQDEFRDLRVVPLRYMADTYNDFIGLFRVSKTKAVKAFPLTFVVFVFASTALTAVFFGLFNVLVVVLTGKQIPQARQQQQQQQQPKPVVKRADIPEVRITEVVE